MRAWFRDSPGDLFGFYHRAVHVYDRQEYATTLAVMQDDPFPGGMQKVPETLATPAARGVLVYRDAEFSRQHGVQPGDIISGVEGWQVDDQRQCRAAARVTGVEFRNHPITGWTN